MQLPGDFNTWYQKKLKASEKAGAIPGTEEKLIRFAPKTEYAILYIHGFGANRKEGEGLVDTIAYRTRFNTYYLRLPGHGTTKEDMAGQKFQNYLQEAEEALQMMQLLGRKTLIFATSMGGCIATYLAEKYSDSLIHGLVLFSPFYDFAAAAALVFDYPFGLTLAELVYPGKLRDTRYNNTVKMDKPGYQEYLYEQQYLSTVVELNALKNLVKRSDLSRVKVPVLLFYYYLDEENQDEAASVAAMKETYSAFTLEPESKLVRVKDGSHVLASEYIHSDKKLIAKETLGFIERLKN